MKKKLSTPFSYAFSFLLTLTVLTTSGLFASKKQKSALGIPPTKALYLSGWLVGNDKELAHFKELANNTEINSYVIDIKEDDGMLSYQSGVNTVKKHKLWKQKYNPIHVLNTLHQNNIRAIGRIVCFKDPELPLACPELAIHDKNGRIWKDRDGQSWLNPYDRRSWHYLVQIAKEALKLGFDEIQFDYVRFTQNGDLSTSNFSPEQLEKKYEAINGFLAYARKKMPRAILSADIFGIVLESNADTEGIGQYLELVGKNVDYLCPMVYPSHYGCGQVVNNVQFDKPDFDPHGVVYNALMKGKERLKKTTVDHVSFHPYLQDFTASYMPEGSYQEYGSKQVREQIEAVYKAGYKGWIFWNIEGKYSEAAFLPEE